MVTGLGLFREHFREYTDRYVLIGGAACDLAMGEAGIDFRVTKGLDIVLHVEALDKLFVEAFWEFVRNGNYQSREQSTGERRYYRFQTPKTEGYPVMLELFSRRPDVLSLAGESHLTPIPTDEDVSSLSAILLNDDYYHFVLAVKRELDGISFVGPECLIPLKAKAWLDLSERKGRGESVDSKTVKKHKNDVFRLFGILSPDFDGETPRSVKDDLGEFIARMKNETIDYKSLGLGDADHDAVLNELRRIYGLE